jgi:23S rRNA pseudouridine1911/1915/1917 synthase
VMRGKRAITHITRLTSGPSVSILRVRLETGRTHQIRVHLADLGYPLAGDPVYGRRRALQLARLEGPVGLAVRSLQRQALHAERLAFSHPRDGRPMAFSAPTPVDLAALQQALCPQHEDPARDPSSTS